MQLLAWYDQNKRPLPWRLDQASLRDPYRTWISEVMLQQTLIPVVIPAYQRFLDKFPDVFTLSQATEDDLRPVVKGLGYYRRFGMLHKSAKIIAAASAPGKPLWPENQEGWKALPGIGEYTSAAISSIAFGIPVPVIDGNVERVLCRLADIRKAPNLPELKPQYRRMLTKMLGNPVATARPGDFNQAMMELGQRVCTPKNPDCDACPVSSECTSRKAKSQHLAPAPKIRPAYEEVRLQMIIGLRPGLDGTREVALFRRGSKSRFLKGSRGFWFSEAWDLPIGTQNVGAFRHSITKHKITADVQILEMKATTKKSCRISKWTKESPDWVPAGAVEDELISNLDVKAWRLVTRRFQL